MTRRTPEEVSKMAAMRLPEKSPVPAPPKKAAVPATLPPDPKYPCFAHDTEHHHAYAIAQHRIEMLEKQVRELTEQNFHLKSLALHGLIFRIESLATTDPDMKRSLRLVDTAQRFRSEWKKTKEDYLTFKRRHK